MTRKVKSIQVKEAIKPMLPGFRIEAEGAGKSVSVMISGAIAIESFSDNETEVKTKRENIKIGGKSLKISVFESKNIEISGKIDSICFLEKTNKRRAKNEN